MPCAHVVSDPVTVYSWFISTGLARIRRADCVMTEACRKEPFSRRRARPAPLSPHANAYTRVSAAFTMATIASANVAPQVSAPACSPGPLRTPRDLERDNWNPSQRKAASRRSAPRRNPPLTSSVLPHAPQRAALRATKAIAPSRAAFVAKPQVRPGSRDPTEPNLEPASTGF